MPIPLPRRPTRAEEPDSGWLNTGAERARSLLQAWRERRATASCCRELLALHERVSAGQPQLAGIALYREIVAARQGHESADELLRHAEESYAIWPVSRTLTFRDVVHYLAVSQFVGLRGGVPGAEADVRGVVDAFIPRHL